MPTFGLLQKANKDITMNDTVSIRPLQDNSYGRRDHLHWSWLARCFWVSLERVSLQRLGKR